MIDACFTHFNLVNSGVAGLNFTKFLLDARIIAAVNAPKCVAIISNPIRNASATNEDEVGQFCRIEVVSRNINC